jgi:cytochrome P450
MLTSFITANTPRDINVERYVDADLLRPMTDKEICGNLLDAMVAGTDTVSKLFFFFKRYSIFFIKFLFLI